MRIDNRDDRRHTVRVVFARGRDTASSDRYTVPPGEEVEASDLVPAGEYAVTVTLDSGPRTSLAFTMQGCTDNTLFASIDDDGDLEASVLDEC